MPYVITRIDMGCGCCSYVPIASYDRQEDIPAEYLTNPNIEIDYDEDDD